jgi:hypothetical protein
MLLVQRKSYLIGKRNYPRKECPVQVMGGSFYGQEKNEGFFLNSTSTVTFTLTGKSSSLPAA